MSASAARASSPAMLFNLRGGLVVVAGSSRGLGWATARALAAVGARVVLNGRDKARLAAAAFCLAAPGSSEMTGRDVTVDGGLTAML